MMKKIHYGVPAVLAAAAVVVALVAAPALADQKFEDKFEKTVPLSKTGRLYLSNLSGDIEVMTWKEAQVKIEALKTSKASSLEKAKENAAKVTVEVSGEGELVRVETKYPRQSGKFWGGDSVNVSVDYKVWVPEQAAVELVSTSGDVEVAPIGGPAKIKSVSGNVSVRGAAGADIDLTSGDLTLKNIAGDVFVNNVSGDIEISGIKGSVEVKDVSGDIELLDVSGARTINAKSVSGNIIYAGTIENGGRYMIEAFSGDVRLTIPAASSFDLEANTFSGDIASEFEVSVVGKLSHRELRGTVGKGGATLVLKTFSGNVDLKKK
ncbi:MAG TPA: DUF4097 family beta strand repeat-containing protein [Candidatus Aminicenantes bacterium]|nr:DUF4097 family beta strand repeat-containing protein [Candidatus Aminicenantes bacterium]HRY63933.1 DUF4097 family beta strand repeat-containing protein [Candidatus Aminicenantes bacterium]HRZ70846.1 DUF4097 family beta strand repeat-containing protein [Candidatus Aminicenantes bacterium]